MKSKINLQLRSAATTALVFCGLNYNAQVSTYSYAQTNSVYTAIAGGTVHATGTIDDNNYTNINIGFSFKFNCIDYTAISINANGFIAMGNTVTSTYNAISGGGSNNIVSALNFDLQGNAGGEIRSQLTGTAPNRVFVVQWSDYRAYTATGDVYNFQVRLTETSNVIETHYGAFTQNATNRTTEIGLRGASNADFKNLNCSAAWNTAAAGTLNTNTVQLQAARKPATGQKYTFTPNVTPLSYTSSTVTDLATGANVEKCLTNVQMSKIEILGSGGCGTLNLSQILVNLTGTSALTAASKVHIYYTGTTNTFSASNEFVAGGMNPASSLTFTSTQALSLGTNYFWITFDFNGTGTNGQTMGADMPASSITVGGTAYTPTASPNCLKTFAACTPGPGGIPLSSLWLKSDMGTSTTTNNATVSSWNSQAISPSVSVTQATNSLRPVYKEGSGTGTANRFNYNPFLYTDGTSNNLIQTGDINLCTTTNGVSVFQVIGEDNGIVALDWYHTSNGNIKIKGDGLMYINTADGISHEGTYSASFTVEAFLQTVKGIPDGINGNGKYNGVNSGSYANGWRVAGQNGICIGSNLDNSEYMQGGMGEFIIYPSVLSASQTLKVESYLAVKHGITLGSSASPSNYVSSDGTITYTGTSAYHDKVIGIGRDDLSALLQKQSHNYDDTVRIYKGSLATTNINNASTFAVDKSFVIVGANTGKMCSTTAALTEMPLGLTGCLLTSRIAREWKVTNTNYAETFNMDFKLNTCGAPGSVNVAHLRLLVDDDGNFANGGTQCYYNGDGSGVVFTYANPTITVSNIANAHIGINSTKFITIASINLATPLPIELILFDAKLNENNTTYLNWETSSERNNDFFTVEKSSDGENWDYLGTRDGAGTSSISHKYDMEDENPEVEMNYYRLKQTDFNGTKTYSSIKSVSLKSENDYLLYPNPSQKFVNLHGLKNGKDEITIINSIGQEINFEMTLISEEQIQINTENFANGIYFVNVKSDNKSTRIKLSVFN